MANSVFHLRLRSRPVRRQALAQLFGAVALLFVEGCGPRRARPVDIELARASLIQVLDHWKQGGSAEDLQQARPAIVVQEPLWTQDRTLLNYTLLGDGHPEDANWYCEVELEFPPGTKIGRSAKSTTTVTYVVGTDPVITVFHAVL